VLDAGTDVAAEAKRLTGTLGMDAALDAVGVVATRRAASQAVRPGGRVVLIGLHDAESSLPINDIIRGEVHLAGSFAYPSDTFERALGLLQVGLSAGDGRWLEERPLAAGPEAFEQLLAGSVRASKILLRPDS
jgi:threonine dehydrogenase-like Zn-dependent dehydrogenase